MKDNKDITSLSLVREVVRDLTTEELNGAGGVAEKPDTITSIETVTPYLSLPSRPTSIPPTQTVSIPTSIIFSLPTKV
jgi:hypothetical protein